MWAADYSLLALTSQIPSKHIGNLALPSHGRSSCTSALSKHYD